MKPIHEDLRPDKPPDSDLERLTGVLRNRVKLILACFLLAVFAAFALSVTEQKKYTASASLLFRDPGFAQSLFGTDVQTQTDPTREAATNVELVGLTVVAQRTAEALGEPLTTARVKGEVGVSQQGTSDVVAVRATDPDPERARRIANTFAREFISFRADADRSKLLAAKRLADRQFSLLSPVEQQGARGQALSTAAEKLGVLASLQTGNAELVQAASLPTSPSYPRPIRNALIGGVLGLLLGIALALLLERISRPLRDAAEAGAAFGLPVVGTIPNSPMIASGSEWLPFSDVESFQTLRGALHYFNHDRILHSVVVTSASASEGKSTVAWNLAVVAASSTKTVLVEADLRRPTLAQTHSLFPTPGLTDLLTKQVQLQDALQTLMIEPDADSLHGGGQSLDIIVAGSAPPNPAQLLEGSAMELLLAQLAHNYDLIVIDTPPVRIVADAFPLLTQVDGVLAVCRVGETTQDSAAELRERLERLGAPLLGVVVNGVRQSRRGRRYGYGYFERNTHGTAIRPPAPDSATSQAADQSAAAETLLDEGMLA